MSARRRKTYVEPELPPLERIGGGVDLSPFVGYLMTAALVVIVIAIGLIVRVVIR